jgi:hypothetical protein
LIRLAERYIAPSILGLLFHISFISIGMVPESETMGFIMPMFPNLIRVLFVLLFLLLGEK